MNLKQRIARWLKITKWLLYLCGLMLLVGWWYFDRLGDWADEHLAFGFNWDLPSRIYSDVEYLYPGRSIDTELLRKKLDRLGYRDRAATVTSPGDYAFLDGALEIYLHDFDYPHGAFQGFPVHISLAGTSIGQITAMDSGKSFPTIRLEPELIASIFSTHMEDRTLVRLDELPDACIASIVLIEDERFFQHRGIDLRGIARAAVADLKALKMVQGGSTLTQQLVKNYLLSSERSIQRKIKEALIAISIERRHSKHEILEAYVNEIYLGQRGSSSVTGYGEAARLYYGKNADQLSAGECALLAGMIHAPSRYSPFTKKDSARDRRNFVLQRIHAAGIIDDAQYAAAKAEAIITPKRKNRVIQAPYFIDFVRQQLKELYSDDLLRTEGLRIFTTLDMTQQQHAEHIVKAELARLETDFAKGLPKDRSEALQSALISMQPQTGFVRAMVGGRSYSQSKFNRATQAKRQPGSVFKPFVFLSAFDPSRSEVAIAPSTYVHDTAFTVRSGGEDWTPRNYDKKSHGPVTARTALAKSYNIATARLAIDVGLDNVVQTARDAGLTGKLQAVPAMALGAFEVTPLEVAAAYTVFPNNGLRAEPLSIIHVTTKEGTILDRDDIALQRRFTAGPAYLTTQTMQDVFKSGTAIAAPRYGFTGVAAGKTGTTSSYRDAWFAGFTPELLTVTWVGYDDNAEMNMSGSRAALPMWSKFMAAAGANHHDDFAVPQSIVLVKIDPASGDVWSDSCDDAIFAPFIEGSEPTELCPLHNSHGNRSRSRWKWGR